MTGTCPNWNSSLPHNALLNITNAMTKAETQLNVSQVSHDNQNFQQYSISYMQTGTCPNRNSWLPHEALQNITDAMTKAETQLNVSQVSHMTIKIFNNIPFHT